jgi:hypothetical protein
MINWPKEILQNKYTRWYENIIAKAKEKNYSVSKRHAKNYEGYTEVHHIIPKAFGGSNDKDNLVRFSAREHFICHWLLTKMTTGSDRNKMLCAFVLMSGDGSKSARYDFKITSSRIFEKIRRDYSSYISKKQAGREILQSTREKISKANIGKKHSEEINKSKGRKGRPGPVHSAEARARIGAVKRGKTFIELYGEEKANALKEKCKNIGTDNGMYGKKHTEETRLKFKDYHSKPETKKFKSDRVKGDKNPAKRPDVKEKISQAQRERLAQQKILGIGHYNPELMAKRKQLSKGASNGNSKTYKLFDPSGVEYIVSGGLEKFCNDNGVGYHHVRRVLNGEKSNANGWTIQCLGFTKDL